MARIIATINNVDYEINKVVGRTPNNVEIEVPLSIDGGGGGGGSYTESNTITINGASLLEETIPIASSSYAGYKIAHGLSSAPRAIIITSNSVTDGTLKGKMIGGYLFTDKVQGYNQTESRAGYYGAMITTNATTGVVTAAPYFLNDTQNTIASWGIFGVDNTYFYFNKAANNQAINTDATYTFLFLA